MSELPPQHPEIARYGLRLSAGELDDALVRFTRPERRLNLHGHLFLYSRRWIVKDDRNTVDGFNAAVSRVGRLRAQTNRLKGHSFKAGLQRYDGMEHDMLHIFRHKNGRSAAVDIPIAFGSGAQKGVLDPDLYRVSSNEIIDPLVQTELMTHPFIPSEELTSRMASAGIALFRYSIIDAVDDLKRPYDYLREVLREGASTHDLNVVDLAHPRTPHPTDLPPNRSQRLLTGRESYPIAFSDPGEVEPPIEHAS